MKYVSLTIIAISLLFAGHAQNIETPRPSPNAKVSQDFGLTKVKIDYSRPGVKDRKIFGELVPYGKVWRTGANSATNIEFKGDVMVEGQALKAGKYALLSIPGESEWTIIFSKNTTVSAPKYKEEEDALRVTVKSRKYTEKVETFTISTENVKDDQLDVQLLWENTAVSFNVKTDVDGQVMKTIEKTMAGVSARDYYLSASYYYKNDKDIKQALEWINKSVEMDGDKPKFWVVYVQAQILAKAGETKKAIAAAELSKELSTKAKYDSYIKKNDELLMQLKKK